jgi:hypothetical protein
VVAGLTTLAKYRETMREKGRHVRETSNSFISTFFCKKVLFICIIKKKVAFKVCLY